LNSPLAYIYRWNNQNPSGYRLITHLSYPPSNSVNDFIDNKFSTVQYSSFDKAISIVKKLDKNALIAKMDIKSAFRLLLVYPGDFNDIALSNDEYWTVENLLSIKSFTLLDGGYDKWVINR
jgi:hypothetical protein